VPIDALTAYAHVADVGRSVEFYRHLGLEVQSSYESDGKLVWALVARPGKAHDDEARARLMLALASGPVDAGNQAVLFYCWTTDVQGLHHRLVAAGIEVGEVTYPLHMPAGEFRTEDPDGYVLLVGQPGDAG
jgi:catechol 2,3-dioxygenase-like lactoylglutathione lyase family enzyme